MFEVPIHHWLAQVELNILFDIALKSWHLNGNISWLQIVINIISCSIVQFFELFSLFAYVISTKWLAQS